MKRRKYEGRERIKVDTNEEIEDIGEKYKYLGILEADGIMEGNMKSGVFE